MILTPDGGGYASSVGACSLCCPTIDESSWKDVDNRVRGLKQKYFPSANASDIELHATDIFNHKGPFKNMSLDKRMNIFSDIMAIISDVDCSISAVLIRKDELLSKDMEVDTLALEFLFERLCYYHEVMNGVNKMEGREEQYGILMIDSITTKYDNKMRSKIRALFETGTRYNKNRYMIEDPIFVDSSYRHLSKLVDCIAYCIRRKFRKAEVDQHDRETFDRFFKTIEPKLLKNGNALEGYSLKVFPKATKTKCDGE